MPFCWPAMILVRYTFALKIHKTNLVVAAGSADFAGPDFAAAAAASDRVRGGTRDAVCPSAGPETAPGTYFRV